MPEGNPPMLGMVCIDPTQVCLPHASAAAKIRDRKQADLGVSLTTKRTRKRDFLDEMNRIVPWAALVELVQPYAPEGRRGRLPFALETMLRIHFMHQLVHPERPGDGRIVARHRVVEGIRRSELGQPTARRDDDPAVSAIAGDPQENVPGAGRGPLNRSSDWTFPAESIVMHDRKCIEQIVLSDTPYPARDVDCHDLQLAGNLPPMTRRNWPVACLDLSTPNARSRCKTVVRAEGSDNGMGLKR